MSKAYYGTDITEIYEKLEPVYQGTEKTIQAFITAGQNLAGLEGASYNAVKLKFTTNYTAYQTRTITCRENALKKIDYMRDTFLTVDNFDYAIIYDDQLTDNITETTRCLNDIFLNYLDYNSSAKSVSDIVSLDTLPSEEITGYTNELTEFINKLKTDLDQADADGTKAINDCFADYLSLINDILSVFDINVQIELLGGISKLKNFKNPYLDKIKNNNRTYNWGVLNEIMYKKPEDLTPYEVLAMIEMLDSFNLDNPKPENLDYLNSKGYCKALGDYNKFLNACYINPKSFREFRDGDITTVFSTATLSPVVAALYNSYTASHKDELDAYLKSTGDGYGESGKELNEIQRIIFNMSVLKNLPPETRGNRDYTGSDPDPLATINADINLRHTEGGSLYDYTLKNNYDTIGYETTVEIKEFRAGNSINHVAGLETKEYLLSGKTNVVSNVAISSIMFLAGFIPHAGAVLAPAELFSIFNTAKIETAENKAIDNVVSMGDLGSTMEALGINAAVSISDNTMSIDYAAVDEDDLAFKLWLYKNQEGPLSYTEWFFANGDTDMDVYAGDYALTHNGKPFKDATLKEQQDFVEEQQQESSTND